MNKISISVLDINIFELEKQLNLIKTMGIKRIHLDILDTSFVKNISFGPSIVNEILEFNFIFDVHIMVDYPLIVLKKLNLAKVDLVIIHWESKGRDEALAFLRENNCKVGLAINPDTPVQGINIKDIHLVLIMAVHPGFGGQSFIKSTIRKVEYLKNKTKVGVDGGVNLDNIQQLKEFDLIVIGSSFTKSSSQQKFIKEIVRILNED